MVAVRITLHGILFWFRSHTTAEIKWGGAKHDSGENDNGTKMHPRSSFKAFLEVVKKRSVPWKDYEMDVIHSLQLILRNAFKYVEAADLNTSFIQSNFSDIQIHGLRELEAVTSEMVRLIESATVPILAVDCDGVVNGWNTKISQLTGIPVEEAVGKHIASLVEDSSIDIIKHMLQLALQGNEEKNVQFEIKRHQSMPYTVPISLVVNACASKDVNGNVVGVCLIAQDITGQKTVMDKFTKIEGDYKAIIQSPNPLIPPIFGTDEFGWCSEWNPAMSKLTGWSRQEVIDKMLLGEVFGTQKSSLCEQEIGWRRMTRAYLPYGAMFAMIWLAGITALSRLPRSILIGRYRLRTVAGQVGALEPDLNVLPKYRFHVYMNLEKPSASAGAGVMVPMDISSGDSGAERVVLPQDSF